MGDGPDDAEDLVVLLDEVRRPIGTAPRAEVHNSTTALHLAFSCYLFHADTGDALVTRRALTKRAWPGVWSNSCCGHPRPGEDIHRAATRRVREELGLNVADLRMILPNFSYRAVDHAGVVENEHCPVLVGSVDADPAPEESEVCAWSWASWSGLCSMASDAPWALSPWAVMQIPQLDTALSGTLR